MTNLESQFGGTIGETVESNDLITIINTDINSHPVPRLLTETEKSVSEDSLISITWNYIKEHISDSYKKHLPWINDITKRASDLALLTVFSPLIIPFVAGVFIKSAVDIKNEEGPDAKILYKQEVLVNGKTKYVWKIRTMYPNSHEKYNESVYNGVVNPGASFKNENDPRITKTGKKLRKHSLDEVLQFWNVLKNVFTGNEFYLVAGNRPQHLKALENAPEKYSNDLRNGIVGAISPFQVYRGTSECKAEGRYAHEYKSLFHKKFMLFYDYGVLLRTIPAMIKGRNS